MEPPPRRRRLAAFAIDLLLIIVPMAGRYPGLPGLLRAAAALSALGVLGAQAWLLSKQGQTIGKRACRMRIVRVSDGESGGFWRNVVVRSVLARWVLGLVPFYFLVDSLFIFHEDGRCLHDLIAGTRVISTL